MPVLHVVENIEDGHDLRRLTFDAAIAGYDTPGQFVSAAPAGLEPRFFAIASVPGEPLVLLVKRSGDTAEAIAALGPGAPVEMTDAMGKGFAVDDADAKTLVILATGSGISAVRPVVEAEIARGLPRPVTVYYGAFTPGHRSFVSDLDRWSEAGIDLRMVYDGDVDGWSGHSGFVQQAAQADGFVRDDVTVVLCGFPGMVNDARTMWTDAGAAPEQLLTNY